MSARDVLIPGSQWGLDRIAVPPLREAPTGIGRTLILPAGVPPPAPRPATVPLRRQPRVEPLVIDALERPVKSGGQRTYQNEVAVGHDVIHDREVDGDLDTLYVGHNDLVAAFNASGAAAVALWIEDPVASMLTPNDAVTVDHAGLLLDDQTGRSGLRFKHSILDPLTRFTGVGGDDGLLYLRGGDFGISFRGPDDNAVLAQLQADGGFLPNYYATGATTRTLAAGANNDLSPGALAVLAVSATGAANITGIAGGSPGRLLWLIATGAQPLVVNNEHAASVAANRIQFSTDQGYTGADPTLRAGGCMLLRYAGTPVHRWQALTPIPAGKTYDADHLLDGSIGAAKLNPAPSAADVGKVLTVAAGPTLAWQTPSGGGGGGAPTSLPVTTRVLIGGLNNNVDPGPLAAVSISAPSFASITGFSGGTDGRLLWVFCTGAQAIDINSDNALSLAPNRIALRADQLYGATDPTLRAGGYMLLRYDGAAQRWRVLTPQPVGQMMNAQHLINNSITNTQLGPTCIMASNINPQPFGSDVGKVLTVGAGPALLWQAPTGGPPSGTAGGDLGGSYPTPIVIKAAGTFATADTLTALIPTSQGVTPILALGTGSSPVRFRIGSITAGNFQFYSNASLNNLRDDPALPALAWVYDAPAQEFGFYGAPAGAGVIAWTQMMALNATGLSLAGTVTLAPTSTAFTALQIGSGQVKGRMGVDAQGGVYVSSNVTLGTGPVYDNTGRSSWQLIMSSYAEQFKVLRAAPGSGTNVALLLVDDVGALTISGTVATKASGTTWANPSDRRLKDEITDYTTGLAAILQLQPRTFVFNGQGETVAGLRGYGFIADEVAPVMPETVSVRTGKLDPADTTETDIQMLDQSNLLLALVNATKELAARVAALEGP